MAEQVGLVIEGVILVTLVVLATLVSKRSGRARLLVWIGTAVLALNAVVGFVWSLVYPQLMRDADLTVYAVAGGALGWVTTILQAGGCVLLIVAAAWGRPVSGPRLKPPFAPPGASSERLVT